MSKFIVFLIVFIGVVSTQLMGGTLIYKVNKNEEKIISDISILSIDRKQVVLKVGNGIERIALTDLVKYYDTNIKIGSAFDDGSSQYDVQIRGLKKTASRTGYAGSQKNRTVSVIDLEYDISIKNNSGNQSRKAIKQPYFYLYVLTTDENNKRKVFVYHYPDAAKCNFKNYDEALMMEKVLSSERESMFLEHGKWQSNANLSWQSIKFKMDGIKERKIIATYLIVWGKDRIICEEGEIWDPTYSIHPDWYARPTH